MPEQKEVSGRRTSMDIVLVIVAIIGIIIALVTLYFQYFKKPTLPPVINGNGNGPIPGTPQLWDFDIELETLAKTIWYPVGQARGPVHLTTITGRFLLEETKPGAWFTQFIGVEGRVIDTENTHFRLFRKEPPGGLGPGWYSFEATVGLSDITHFYITTTRYYGFGDSVVRFREMRGEAFVVV